MTPALRAVAFFGLLASVAPAGVARIAHAQAQGADDPRASAGGKIGDFVGLWECIDTQTHWSTGTVEFRSDGTYGRPDTPNRANAGNYEMDGATLTLFLVVPASARPNRNPRAPAVDVRVIEEQGPVEWVDGDLFKFRVTGSRMRTNPQRKVYEFHRLTGRDDPEKAGSLIGSWEAPSLLGRPWILAMRRDGSFQDHDRAVSPNPTVLHAFRYQGTILSLIDISTNDHNRETLVKRGKVTWQDNDHFTLKLVGGVEVQGQRKGQEFDFARQVTGALDRDRGAMVPPGGPDGGAAGDFRGIWECVDPTTRRALRVVEFRSDGTYADSSEGREKPGRYQYQGGSLSLLDPVPDPPPGIVPGMLVPGRRNFPRERGSVTWVDGDLFKYQVENGATVGPFGRFHTGDVHEFHRVNRPASPAISGSLIGTWEQVDPETNRPHRVLEFKRDGTYRVEGRRALFPEPHDFYEYKEGLLALIYVFDEARQQRMERGKVAWRDEDHFVYTILDGPQVADRLGKVYECRRKK